MFYYNKKGNTLEKYEIDFNRRELENLKIQVINECSIIIHKEYEGLSINAPNKYDYLKIRNYKEKFNKRGNCIRNNKERLIGYNEKTDFYSSFKDEIYHYSYDEYNYPYLVKIIDMLLNREALFINEILEPKIINPKELIEEKIKQISEEIDLISNQDYNEKTEQLAALKKLLEIKRLHANEKPIQKYYIKLRELLDFKLVDKIDYADFLKLTSFLDIPLDDINNKMKIKV